MSILSRTLLLYTFFNVQCKHWKKNNLILLSVYISHEVMVTFVSKRLGLLIKKRRNFEILYRCKVPAHKTLRKLSFFSHCILVFDQTKIWCRKRQRVNIIFSKSLTLWSETSVRVLQNRLKSINAGNSYSINFSYVGPC